MLTKLHHCMVDGVSGTELLTVMLDPERDPGAPGPRRLASRAPAIGRRSCSRDRSPDVLASPYEQLRAVRSAARSPRRAARTRRDRSRHAAPCAACCADAAVVAERTARPASPLGWARSRLSDVKTVRGALGGTVNDVVLAAIAGGFRDCCSGRGESVAARRADAGAGVRALAGRARLYNNRVSAIFAELPVGIARSASSGWRRSAPDGRPQALEGGRRRRGPHLVSPALRPPMLLALAERSARACRSTTSTR